MGDNRLVTFNTGTTGATDATYHYDGEGRRVKRVAGGVTTVYVYDVFGKLLAEYSQSRTHNVESELSDNGSSGQHPGGDGRLGQCSHPARLSALRRRDRLQLRKQVFRYRATSGLTSGPAQRFTSKERDTDGVDFFLARYYRSASGRFTSVDPIWVTKERMLDPQRLSLYAYVRNNPLRYVDPYGMEITLGRCEVGGVQDCFNELTKGLKREDRAHAHLVEGDGNNRFEKGVYGVMVDQSHKSDSKNFQALQMLAGDDSATARIDVLKGYSKYEVKAFVNWDSATNKKTYETKSATPNDAEFNFSGYTFFPQGEGAPEPFSTGSFTNVVVNASRGRIPSTIHHELRHVLLGDFGRKAPFGAHGTGRVDQETEEAEKEAVKNQLEN